MEEPLPAFLEVNVSIHLLFMLLAIICFTLAAIGVQSSRINLMAAGLALMAVAMIVTA